MKYKCNVTICPDADFLQATLCLNCCWHLAPFCVPTWTFYSLFVVFCSQRHQLKDYEWIHPFSICKIRNAAKNALLALNLHKSQTPSATEFLIRVMLAKACGWGTWFLQPSSCKLPQNMALMWICPFISKKVSSAMNIPSILVSHLPWSIYGIYCIDIFNKLILHEQ